MNNDNTAIARFPKDCKDIHKIQEKVMDWVATDDQHRAKKAQNTKGEDRILMLQIDTLNAISRALKYRGTDYGIRIRGVAQGLLWAAKTCQYFTEKEIDSLSLILNYGK